MATFLCKCGFRMSNSAAPNEVQYRVYSDIEWDQIMRSDTIETRKIPAPKWDVWKCSECQRVYVFDKNGKVDAIFKPDTE